jgi:hypothetical protein
MKIISQWIEWKNQNIKAYNLLTDISFIVGGFTMLLAIVILKFLKLL